MHINEAKIEGPVMLVTSFISLACNMFNLAALGHIPLPCFGETSQGCQFLKEEVLNQTVQNQKT